MKYPVLIGFSLLLLHSCTAFRPSASGIINSSKNELQKINALSYQAELFRIWPDGDSVILKANVKLLRDTSITTLGNKIQLNYPGKLEIRYNGDTMYYLNKISKQLWVYDIGEMGTGPITSNQSIIGESFTSENPYDATSKETTKIFKLTGAAKIDKQKCWIIESEEKTSDWTSFQKYFISKKHYLPLKTQTTFRLQDQADYSEWKISEVNLNPEIKANDFSRPALPDNFTVEIAKPMVTPKLLPNQMPAPEFKLAQLGQDSVSLSNLKGKIVLLDFWYTSCGPCLKAMPHLERFYEKYQSKGLVVLGLNCKDNQAKDLERLPAFLANRNITYPILIGNNETELLYKVTAYPSLYLIDRNGKIVYSGIGFSEEAIAAIEKEIEKQINGS